MSNPEDMAAIDASLAALGDTMAATEADVTAFSRSLTQVQGAAVAATRDLGALERGFSRGLRQAIDGLVLQGKGLGDIVAGLGQAMGRTAYAAAVNPVADHMGGLMAGAVNGATAALIPFAHGGSFSQGRVMPFAKGGIVSTPTTFAMRGGTGLMGEAGPEAIMPLARGPDGRLGVRGGGGRPVNVAVNITTPDATGIQRSRSQLAALLSRAVAQGARNR